MTERSTAERFAAIEQRIEAACQRVGRARPSVVLIGASKRQPVANLSEAYRVGLRDFGENRVQEGEEKRERLPGDVHWHLLGPLQSNKVARAAVSFDTFHAIDRPKIARRLSAEARRLDRQLVGFLEINLGREDSKHGFDPDDAVESLVRLREESPPLDIVGLMAIPPVEREAERTRAWFRRLRELRDEARSLDAGFPGLLSMGMSGDFELAIEEGATHVRVGTALFGPRPG